MGLSARTRTFCCNKMAVMECSLVRDLEATREHVRALHEFFCKHAKLCNAHAVGFFTEDHWRNIVNADWRGLLLEIEEETEWVTELKVPHGKQREVFPMDKYSCFYYFEMD